MRKSFLNLTVGALVLTLTLLVSAQKPATAPQAAKQAPDVLVFTNGDQLSGKLERGVGNSIFFKSDMAGEITVSLDKVKELRSNGSFAVLRKDLPVTRTALRSAVQPGAISFADGAVTVARAGAAPEVVPAKQMGYIIDQTTYDKQLERRAGPLMGWDGSLTGGATLVRSTTNGDTYNVGLNLVRTIPAVPFLPARNRTTVNVQETYGKQTTPAVPQTVPASNVVVKTSIFHADAERDQYFTPRLYALAATTFDHNYAQGLDLQAVYGGGLGWTPLKTEKQELDLKGDLHYETQGFLSLTEGVAPPSNQNLVGSTFTENYRRNLPRKLVFTEGANILPAWNNSTAYSANVNAGLAMPVFKRLSLQFSAIDNYLNDPSPGFKKNSYQFVTGVTYRLR